MAKLNKYGEIEEEFRSGKIQEKPVQKKDNSGAGVFIAILLVGVLGGLFISTQEKTAQRFTAEYVSKLPEQDGYLLMTGADIKQIDESGSWYPLEDRLILISGTISHSARTTSILHTLDGIKKLKLDYYHTRDINSRVMEPGNKIRVWGSVNPFDDLEIVTCVRTEKIN